MAAEISPELAALSARGRRSAVVGLSLNALLAAAKITGGVLGHSFALVTDGIESIADIFTSLIVYFGLQYAVKPRDDDHPYGHGKAEPLAALAVGLAMSGAGVAIAVQSVRGLLTPGQIPAPYTLIVLVAVLVIKEGLFQYVIRVGHGIGSAAVQADAWHHRSDAIVSGLAFAGISVALLGGKGWERADDGAALLASFIILVNAYMQIRPALAELSDIAPPKAMQDQVKGAARQVPGVIDLDKCFVRKMGLEYFVDLHVIVDGELSVREGHRIAHLVKNAVREKYPRISEVLVHIEPTGPRPLI
jgi:cation diffusion facilitator family transporter